MSQKGRTTTLEERVAIAEQAEAGRSSREIAIAMGCPIAKVQKWRQRYRCKGRAGLSSQMGRPAGGALASVSAEMKAAILALREKHPGWGAQTIRLEVAQDERFAHQHIPSRARIAAFLQEHKKVRHDERHPELPQPKAEPIQRPHQEWEMDAQGVTTIAGIGQVSFLNALDVHSHTSVDSHACLKKLHPTAQDYQHFLRRAFLFLNQHYPTRALGGRPPFQAFPQARHSGRPYSPETEEQRLDMQRIEAYLQQGRWFRLVSAVGTFSLGGHLYNVTTRFAGQTLEITFDGTQRKLLCLPEKQTAALELDIQGLTKAALMGAPTALPAFMAYQLALPFPSP